LETEADRRRRIENELQSVCNTRSSSKAGGRESGMGDETHSKKFGFLILGIDIGIDMKYRRRERQ
jgi:hypothetical protein